MEGKILLLFIAKCFNSDREGADMQFILDSCERNAAVDRKEYLRSSLICFPQLVDEAFLTDEI